LKNKIPAEQYAEMYDIKLDRRKVEEIKQKEPEKPTKKKKTAGKETEKTAAKKERVISEKQKGYGKILDDISGSLKAVLFDIEDKELKKIPVRELTDSLKKSDNISTVVFDGIITQRLLDIANSKNIKEIVGIKLGNVVKMPSSVKVLTKKDLE
jgi:DNA primase